PPGSSYFTLIDQISPLQPPQGVRTVSQFQYGCTEPPSPAKHYRLGVLLFTPTTIKLHVLIQGRKLRLLLNNEDLGQSFRILNRYCRLRYAYDRLIHILLYLFFLVLELFQNGCNTDPSGTFLHALYIRTL